MNTMTLNRSIIFHTLTTRKKRHSKRKRHRLAPLLLRSFSQHSAASSSFADFFHLFPPWSPSPLDSWPPQSKWTRKTNKSDNLIFRVLANVGQLTNSSVICNAKLAFYVFYNCFFSPIRLGAVQNFRHIFPINVFEAVLMLFLIIFISQSLIFLAFYLFA